LPDELNWIRYAQGVQTIVRWSAGDDADVKPLVAADFDANPEEVSDAFRTRLGIKPFQQRSWPDPAVAFEQWRKALEAIGIVVLQLDLGKAAIRGFSLASTTSPLAAVNTSYSYQVRTFTLFHEVAHLITNSSSACVGFAAPIRHVNRFERWCERFAASFLLPAGPVKAFISQLRPKHDPPGLSEVKALSKSFHVSARASAMRLIDLELAESSLYVSVDAQWQPFERDDRRGGRAPLTPLKRLRQVGRQAANQISHGVVEGQIGTLDVLRYLDLTLGQYEDFSKLAAAES
jgi:Zn-dependent peptidase ImmA (M78 family)